MILGLITGAVQEPTDVKAAFGSVLTVLGLILSAAMSLSAPALAEMKCPDHASGEVFQEGNTIRLHCNCDEGEGYFQVGKECRLAEWRRAPSLETNYNCDALRGTTTGKTESVYWRRIDSQNVEVPNRESREDSAGLSCSCRWKPMYILIETTCRRQVEEKAIINGVVRKTRMVTIIDTLKQRQPVLMNDAITRGSMTGLMVGEECACRPPKGGQIDYSD
jgi:hypothetical protein